MAKNYNPGTINLDVATKSILSSGGGISEKTKADGTTHVSVYSTTENRHLSYDKDKNIKLATYASRCIENEILMYLRRNSKIKAEVSIDEPLNVDWDGNELLLSDIIGTDEDIIYRDIETEVECKMLKKAINQLPERERIIVDLRFGLSSEDGEEKTQKEVADMLGISQSYISRLEKKIMRQLRKEMVKSC